MTNVEAFAAARRKQRYGHRNQLVWRDRAGDFHTAERSPAAIKRAMLATGTNGRFTEIAERGFSYVITWPMGVLMIRNARVGC